MATRQITWGDKVRGSDIPKFKGTPAITSIISVIAKEGIRVAQTHYIEGMGNFHCFDGVCCQDAGKAAAVRYLLPVVVYKLSNPSTYEIDLSRGVEVMYHAMGEKEYDKFMAQDHQVYIDQCDLIVMTAEKGRYLEYTFQVLMDPATRMARPAAWRQDEKVRLSVLNYYNTKYLQHIDNSVGREFKSTQEYHEARKKALENVAQNSNSSPSIAYPPQQQFPAPPAAYLPQGASMIGVPPLNNGMIGAPASVQIPGPQPAPPQTIPVQAVPVQAPYVGAAQDIPTPSQATPVQAPYMGAAQSIPADIPHNLDGGMDESAVNELMKS